MRFFKVQIAILFSFLMSVGWIEGADSKQDAKEEAKGASQGSSSGGYKKSRKSEKEIPDPYHDFHRQFYKKENGNETNIYGKDGSYNVYEDRSTTSLTLPWSEQLLLTVLNTGAQIGIPFAVQYLQEKYEKWSDPEEYEKKKEQAAEHEEATRNLQLEALRQQLASNEFTNQNARLSGHKMLADFLQVKFSNVQTALKFYTGQVENITKQMKEVMSSKEIPKPVKQQVVAQLRQKIIQYSEKVTELEAAHDQLTQQTLIASDIRVPGRLDVLGVALKTPEQAAQMAQKEKKNIDESKIPQLSLPYAEINTLLTEELKKAALQQQVLAKKAQKESKMKKVFGIKDKKHAAAD